MRLEQALGIDDSHVNYKNSTGKPLHFECIGAVEALQQQARRHGFDLQIASAFRSFDKQLAIWNAKARGDTVLVDDADNPVDIIQCEPFDIIRYICRWSAIPGASRHHWGCDFDVYDAIALGDKSLQLTDEECNKQFSEFYQWLDDYLSTSECFYRPYIIDTGGIGREQWHISYRPVAKRYESLMTMSALKTHLEHYEIALKPTILENIEWLYQRYVLNLPHE